jgi:hypothetical protein
MSENQSEQPAQNVENVEGDVVNEAPSGNTSEGADPNGNENTPSGNTSDGADTTGDEAQQDTGALQE